MMNGCKILERFSRLYSKTDSDSTSTQPGVYKWPLEFRFQWSDGADSVQLMSSAKPAATHSTCYVNASPSTNGISSQEAEREPGNGPSD